MSEEIKGGVDAVEHDWLNLGLPSETKAPEPVLPVAAPKAEPAPEAPKAPDAKAEPVAPAPTPAPAAEAPKPAEPAKPATSEGTPENQLIKDMLAKQAQTDASLRALIDENAKLVKAQTDAANPVKPLSPEELQAKAEADRNALLADPEAYLKEKEAKLRETLKAEAEQTAKSETAKALGYNSVREMELGVASTQGVARLTADSKQFPLMAEDSFRNLMADDANLKAVFQQFPKDSDPVSVLKTDAFWMMAYQRAAIAKLAGDTKSASGGAAGDEAPITPVTPGPAGSSGGTAPADQKSADDQLWDEIANAGSLVLK